MKKETKIWIYALGLAGILCVISSCSKKTEDTDPNLSSMVWVKQNSGTNQNLCSVYFPKRDTGYAVGYYADHTGLLLKTTDGGITWISVNIPNSTLYSIQFVDVNTGYAVGDNIFKTINGGRTWTNQPYPEYPCSLTSVCFTDRNKGYAAGHKAFGEGGWVLTKPVMLKTIDGGINWTIAFQEDTVGSLNSVFFKDANNGYSGGGRIGYSIENLLLKTTDGGINWKDISTTLPGIISIEAGCFADNNTGYMVGEDILKTKDGGSTWERQQPPDGYLGNYNSVYFTSVNKGYIVGTAGYMIGLILETSDGGATWKGQTLNNTGNLRSVFFPDANTGYAVGDGGVILKITIGGTGSK